MSWHGKCGRTARPRDIEAIAILLELVEGCAEGEERCGAGGEVVRAVLSELAHAILDEPEERLQQDSGDLDVGLAPQPTQAEGVLMVGVRTIPDLAVRWAAVGGGEGVTRTARCACCSWTGSSARGSPAV